MTLDTDMYANSANYAKDPYISIDPQWNTSTTVLSGDFDSSFNIFIKGILLVVYMWNVKIVPSLSTAQDCIEVTYPPFTGRYISHVCSLIICFTATYWIDYWPFNLCMVLCTKCTTLPFMLLIVVPTTNSPYSDQFSLGLSAMHC